MRKVWILVRSKSGVFFEPEIFYSQNDADRKRKLYLAKDFNPAYDEVQVFDKRVVAKSNGATRRRRQSERRKT